MRDSRFRCTVGLLVPIYTSAVTAGALAAQTPVSPTESASRGGRAATITAAELARHIDAISQDSTGGRATPSPGLDLAAQYVAEQFKALGLKPGGDPSSQNADGERSWFQRYPVPGRLRIDYDSSHVAFWLRIQRMGKEVVDEDGNALLRGVRLDFATTARPAGDTARIVPTTFASALAQRGVLVAGRHTAATVRQAGVRDKFVLYMPPAGTDSVTRQDVLAELFASNDAVVVVADEDSAEFTRRAQAARRRPFWLLSRYMNSAVSHGWAVYARADAVRDFVHIVDVDLDEVRAAAQPLVRSLPSLAAIQLLPVIDTVGAQAALAPNVVGVLEGTEPALAGGPVVISAHLDRSGRSSRAPGVAGEGPDDNALGVAALLAVAKAFSRPDARPRRPIVFLATSGGAEEFWGARYYLRESSMARAQTVLNLTLDLRGGGRHDSVVVTGLSDLERVPRPDWMAAAHSELRLTVVDAGRGAGANSDYFAFIEDGVPSLRFSNGDVPSAPTGGANAIERASADQAARIASLVYYMADEAANADLQPRWNQDGRRRRAALFGR